MGDPSTLYTRIGWVNFIKLSQQLFAYCLSINLPIALESTRVVMDPFSAVSVVSISTFNFSEFGVSSVAVIINFSGRAFSHFGFCTLGINGVGIEIGVRFSSTFCLSEEGILESDIFANTSKWLQVDNKGMLFTCCLVQNPPLLESHALTSLIKFLSEVYPSYSSTPFLTLWLLTTLYQTSGGSPELYAQVDGIYNRSAELGSFFQLMSMSIGTGLPGVGWMWAVGGILKRLCWMGQRGVDVEWVGVDTGAQ